LLLCVLTVVIDVCGRVQFYHEVGEYEQWMMTDLAKLRSLVTVRDVQPDTHSNTANELLLELKVFPTHYCQHSAATYMPMHCFPVMWSETVGLRTRPV